MAEPVTTIAASTIVMLAFQKFIESGAGELAKKFTGSAITKMDELRQKIWCKLRGKSHKVDEALAKVGRGDCEAIATIAKNLDVVMDENPGFATEVQAIAQEINAGRLLDQSHMTQYNYGQATGIQTKVDGGTAHIGRELHIYEKSPKDDG
jgi:hypothetical protein